MQASAKSLLTVRMVRGIIQETMPGPLPKPPGRPPGEPIIIKDPSRPPEAPEIDGSLDEEENEDPEIKGPPGIIPEMPPPPRPEEQAASTHGATRSSGGRAVPSRAGAHRPASGRACRRTGGRSGGADQGRGAWWGNFSNRSRGKRLVSRVSLGHSSQSSNPGSRHPAAKRLTALAKSEWVPNGRSEQPQRKPARREECWACSDPPR